MPAVTPATTRLNAILDDFAEPLKDQLEGELAEVDSTLLHGQTAKSIELEQETPKHRHAIHLKLQGYSNVEIGARVGFHPNYVSSLLHTPWVVEYMSKMRDKNFAQKVEVLLKDAVAPAVERLIIEMDNPTARPAERINAADKILDRLFGRAAQPIIHSKTEDPRKMTDAEIQERLAQLQGTVEQRS